MLLQSHDSGTSDRTPPSIMTVIFTPYRETQSNLSAHKNDSKKTKVGRAGAATAGDPPASCALGKEPHLR